MKDEFGCLFPVLFGKGEVTTKTAEGESDTRVHGNSESARAPCTRPVCSGRSGQARGGDTVEDEDTVHDTEAVISFSLKCLKVGTGWCRTGWASPTTAARPGKAGRWPGRPSAPPAETAEIQMCFLPHGPRRGAAAPHPPCALALSPTESKTFQPAESGRGPQRTPSADTRPHGRKGSGTNQSTEKNLKLGKLRLHIPQSAGT